MNSDMSDCYNQHDESDSEQTDGSKWTVVRRGTPAEEVANVPDDTTVWYCIVKNRGEELPYKSITVYNRSGENKTFYILIEDGDEQICKVTDFISDIGVTIDTFIERFNESDYDNIAAFGDENSLN